MGNAGDLHYCFTNVNGQWLLTVGHNGDPWEIRPALADLPGFDIRWMLGVDVLHVWHIGIGRDLIGSVLKILIKDKTFFAGRTIPARMKQASVEVQAFAKRNKYQLRLRWLTHSRLQWSNTEYPMLKCKGADTSTYLLWLAELLEARSCEHEQFAGIKTAVISANLCLKILTKCGVFLKEEEAELCSYLGLLYWHTYVELASWAVQEHLRLFKVRPKGHLWQHMCLDLIGRPSRRNPINDACWMDEDYIGKICRICNKTHPMNVCIRALQRYLLMLGQKLSSLYGAGVARR
jgi:hypothetical protein